MNESTRAVLDDEARPRTVGERLDGVGRRIIARSRWTSVVGEGRAPSLRRAEALAGLFAGRFERDESGADGPEVVPNAGRVGRLPPPAPGAGVPPQDEVAAPPPGSADDRPRPVDGRPLPADVRTRLRDLAGPGADVLLVHDGAAADRVARAHSADAVTVGRDVYFRDGRFRPDEAAGFGLLAHEATHVSAGVETDGAARTSVHDRAAEEDVALAREWLGRGGLPGPAGEGSSRDPARQPGPRTGSAPPWILGLRDGRALVGTGSTTVPPTGGVPMGDPRGAPSPGPVPMTAAVDRPSDGPPPFDVEALRRDLVVDVMNRLRSDAERGA